jgi:isopropylmalate/homocitrate/citramalate synthase
MSTPWKSEKWFTSPWNFADEVRQTHNFAERIQFHDITLRDGEQQAGIAFTRDQKVALAEKLAEMGMHRIEAGMPAVSTQDAQAIKDIVSRNLGPDIYAFSRCMKPDVERAVDCGVKHIVIEIPASEHILQYAYKWSVEKALELSIEATLYAKEMGLYTVFFPIDGSRADMKSFLDIIEKVATDGHMDALVCVDTFGGLAPSASAYLIKAVKKRIGDKPIEVHFHDDFGLAAANTILALAAGADVAHTTVSGIGERAGNAPYEDVALALLTMYGIDTGIKYERMYELSRLIQKLTGLKVRQNRGITGEDIGKIESGIITDWYKNAHEVAPLELSPYLYSLTGHPDFECVIGKGSGITTIEMALADMGLVVEDRDQKMALLMAVKDKSMEKGGLLSSEDFAEIVSRVLGATEPA